MSHEPECGYVANATWEGCMCKQLRAAYQRGRNDAGEEIRLMPSQAMHLHGNCVDQRSAAMRARFGGEQA